MTRIDEKALAAAWAAFGSAFKSHLNFPTENETVGEARLHCMRVAIRAYLSALEPAPAEAEGWRSWQIARFVEALCAEDPGDPLRCSGPKLEAVAKHVLDYVFRPAPAGKE